MNSREEQFSKIRECLNYQYSSHHIDDIVYDAAHRLIEYFNSSKEFLASNSSLNSQADVREMFETLTDEWISDNYLDITSDDPNAMMKYNILTDTDINRVLKDDVFGILWTNK